MKTLKISTPVHRELVEMQAQIYRKQGIKLTFNEIINALLITFKRNEKNDK